MSKSQLRKDKTCLNCNHVVDQRFCPNCGQENTDSRKTFHHLFIHFFEDLTHYENAFWKTIRNLLFKPASLTKEYLSGKRLSYLAPVRLYIFISFVTFLMLNILPGEEETTVINTGNTTKKGQTMAISRQLNSKLIKIDKLVNSGLISKEEGEEMRAKFIQNEIDNNELGFKYNTVAELDSMQRYGPKEKKLAPVAYWFNKKMVMVKERNKGRSADEIIEKFRESFVHNFPKVLFIYMPIFAFFLWLFHGKKRWYYFDHGIFTLHYFSFLLLVTFFILIAEYILSFFDSSILDVVTGFLFFGVICWMFYYFFPAHHRFYGETRTISFLKTIALLFINIIIISVLLICFSIYTFINIH